MASRSQGGQSSGEKRLRGPRCTAVTKAGKPCQALAGAEGLCTAHSGRTNMRELGRKGGRRSPGLGKLPSAERQSLRQYLREQVDPAEVWLALKAALESGSQTAVVSAARLLVTELYEERGEEDRALEMKQHAAEARAKFDRMIRDRARTLHKLGRSELALEFTAAASELWSAGEELPGGVVVQDVSTVDARAVLEGLVDRGLIVPGPKVEEKAEQLAQVRLQALKQEHGIPA